MEFEALCGGPITQYVKSKMPAPPLPFVTQGRLYEHAGSLMSTSSEGTPPTESPPTPPLLQQGTAGPMFPDKDLANWPDFSTMGEPSFGARTTYSYHDVVEHVP